ncbi:leukocyte elastase inhibitor-like [Sinocyclocheilus rhinocerous]|uniref:leukocyte elastase inhibitor-like n=1 Tax=Sinocyclocheilus rhinocerous TaxID=307959 RepID=UPI0007B9C450|nr:PREDICTED: leukocyte elastase inhibitor-like [Sinocyclocheilus rhinocerous]
MEPLPAANTQFSLNLFKKISGGNTSGNVFYSPISISSALAMVSLGAKGNTAAQMFKVLGFTSPPKLDAATPASHQQAQKPCGVKGQHGPSMTQQTQKFELPPELKKSPAQPTPGQKTEEQIHSSFNKLMSELKKPGAPYVLSLANRLYGEQSYQFVEKFLNDAKKYYEAGLEEVDKLVLDGQFKLNKTQTKPVKMMNRKAEFPLALIPEMNSQVLELPYVGKNLSMLIILPKEIEDETTGLQKLEKALTYEKLMEWTRPEVMHQQEVQVSLPKFKMEETYDMKSLLISMGIEDVFDGKKVNLSGMSPNNDLVVSKVIHKAFVEVNEEGTEAAAATGAVMMTRCLRITQVFNADHPFLFFIRHNPTKSILFYGRFCSP